MKRKRGKKEEDSWDWRGREKSREKGRERREHGRGRFFSVRKKAREWGYSENLANFVN